MHLVAIAVIALLVLAGAVIARDDLARLLFDTDAPRTSVAKASPEASRAPRSKEELSRSSTHDPAEKPAVTFDVVRIDPGASVFAGRAPPNSEVAILADGRPVAGAKADETGAWAAVTERRFAPGEVEFSLRAKSGEGREATGQRVRVAIAPPARTEAALPTRDVVLARAIPAPITFVYNEATFTKEGRQAAARLAEYLISQGPKTVSLTGHADERGSDPYNIELSRQRLGAVADYLRDRGFSGELELIPKGRSEPYARADRPALSREDAFQLDRRVELRLAR